MDRLTHLICPVPTPRPPPTIPIPSYDSGVQSNCTGFPILDKNGSISMQETQTFIRITFWSSPLECLGCKSSASLPCSLFSFPLRRGFKIVFRVYLHINMGILEDKGNGLGRGSSFFHQGIPCYLELGMEWTMKQWGY